MNVYIQVIKVYSLEINAETKDEAIRKACDMSTFEIYEHGTLKDISIDHAEVMDDTNDEEE